MSGSDDEAAEYIDDGYVSPVFDLSDHESDDDGATTYVKKSTTNHVPSSKKKRKMMSTEMEESTIDLEALALRALTR